MWWQGWQTPEQIRERVTCPCCRGKKRFTIVRHDDEKSRTFVEKALCLQCDGTGEVEAL